MDHPDLIRAKSSDKLSLRKWAATTKKQLAQFNELNAIDGELLHWYFNTFCTGWGFNLKGIDGNIYKNSYRLTPKLVADRIGLVDGDPEYFGICSSNECLWTCIDIDAHSRYHPGSEEGDGIKPVLQAMKKIGLKHPIEFQSSYSTGIHLWYPLPNPIKSWQLAESMTAAAEKENLCIRDGVLEFFPNQKGLHSAYKCIRAPLSGEGNAIWLDGLGLDDSLAVFQHLFILRAKRNKFLYQPLDKDSLTISSSYTRGQNTSSMEEIKARMEEGFTAAGQTNELQLCARQIARFEEGIDKIDELRNRLIQLMISAPGFYQYCGHQRQIENGSYWSNSCLASTLQLSPHEYGKSWRKRANDKKSIEAQERALEALEKAARDGMKYKTLSSAYNSLKKDYGAPHKSWWERNGEMKLLLRCQLVDYVKK